MAIRRGLRFWLALANATRYCELILANREHAQDRAISQHRARSASGDC
jgi:hypothetical protein